MLSDEGVGVHVVRRLAKQLEFHDVIQCIDGGTLSYELLEWVSSADAVLLIDAIQLDAPAGTVIQLSGDELQRHFDFGFSRTVHQICLRDVLNTARILYQHPKYWALVGVQPSNMTWGDTLSEPIVQNQYVIDSAIIHTLSQWGVDIEDVIQPCGL